MNTEIEVIANQSACIPPTEDQVKILRSKDLLRKALLHIHPHMDPFENDEGYAVYRLRNDIEEFIANA